MRDTLYGRILLQGGRVVAANPAAARLCGISLFSLADFSQLQLLESLSQTERSRLLEAIERAAAGEWDIPALPVCWPRVPGAAETDAPKICLDMLVTPLTYQDQPAVQLLWIERPGRQVAEAEPGQAPRQVLDQEAGLPLERDMRYQDLHRLQILHEIDRGILASQDEQEIIHTALAHLAELVPQYQASAMLHFDFQAGEASLLAAGPVQIEGEWLGRTFRLDELPVELAALQDGLPCAIHDLRLVEPLRPLQERMLAADIHSYLCIPLRWRGQLTGMLVLASAGVEVFRAEHVQIAQEVADSLAVAVQEAYLRRAERQRQREAEVMRDVMAALATAGDLKQTLEALLVHLHGLIHYDRAGLFLVDENQRFSPAGERGASGPHILPAVFQETDPLVAELRRLRRPLVVPDAQTDPRFAQWPELRAMRGWLGAPLLAGDEMLGFLSLGSLEFDAYQPADADTMAMFAAQVAQVLERAWLGEQSHRRAEELEVLSSLTSVLGEAERGENTLFAIIEQLSGFFDARRGVFLIPERQASRLVVKACQEQALVGMAHPLPQPGSPAPADWLWMALENAAVTPLDDPAGLLQRRPEPFYRALLDGAQSAVAIPLAPASAASTGVLAGEEGVFGLLCFAFEARRKFSTDTMRLFQSVAEMAAASLRRAVMLDALEKQVQLRTQHLSTLYHINTLASEPLNLLELLEDVLTVTVTAMNATAGAIHFLDEKDGRLYLVAQTHLPVEVLARLDALPAEETFWHNLLGSTSPLVVPDLATGEATFASEEMPTGADSLVGGTPLPVALVQAGQYSSRAYLGAAVRAKGLALGSLSLFTPTIQDTSIEDITLFATVADQVGGLVERARLVKQAEVVAVVQERQRLARELHDSVTQLLYSQVLFSGAGLKVLRKGEHELAEQHLARIEQAARQALKEMRLLVYELRPSDELDDGLAEALDRRLNAVEKRTGINVHLAVDGLPALDQAVQIGLYRIAEEALNNTLKHAQASSVRVSLSVEGDRLHMVIEDDGRGFDPQAPARGGMGLTNIYERTAALGGTAQVISQPGQGTRLVVELTLGPERRQHE